MRNLLQKTGVFTVGAVLSLVLLVTAPALCGVTASDAIKPDLIFYNGKVVTVDKDFSIAQAVAVKGDKIVAVGKNVELKKLKGLKTAMIDLKGKTLTPGFNDGHMHMLLTGLDLTKVNLRDPKIKTMADLLQAVADRVKVTPKGEWVEGARWDDSKLKEKRFPTRADIDPISPDHPVFLKRTCAHIVVVNTKALQLAGITKDTPSPPGGEIVKDEKGEPTGVLMEKAAFNLVEKVMPQPNLAKKKEAILAACKAFNAVGITSVNDGGSYVDDYRAYQEVMNEGKLTVRVYAMAWVPLHEQGDEEVEAYLKHIGPRHGFGNEYLKLGAVKFITDGGIGARTAYMRTPYITGKPNNFGMQTISQERLVKFVKMVNAMGWQAALHACGGKAMDKVIEAMKEADREVPIKGKRWYFVHGYDPSPENLADMKRMEMGVAANPGFIHFLGDSFVENMNREWAYKASPQRTYLSEGIHISGGSDSGVTPFPPLWGIYGAVARKTQLSKEVCGPEQRISVRDALRMYTVGGCWMSFEENVKGSIEPGRLADMVILGEDILAVDAEKIPAIPIVATYVGGKLVYGKP